MIILKKMSHISDSNRKRIYLKDDSESKAEDSRRSWSKKVVQTRPNFAISYNMVFPQEDELLLKLVQENEILWWANISSHFPGRSGKQCSER